MTISLTARQQDTLRFICGFQEAHGGVSPYMREIGVGVGVAGKSSVFRLLTALEDRRAIRRLAGRVAAIEVIRPIAIPRAPDGAPLYFVPIKESV